MTSESEARPKDASKGSSEGSTAPLLQPTDCRPLGGEASLESEGKEADDFDPDEHDHKVLVAVRGQLRVGAVFRIPDRITHRTDKIVVRPALIIGRTVATEETPEIALTRSITVALRLSWKPHFAERYGEPSPDQGWVQRLAIRPPHWLYTPARLLSEFNKSGVFELERRVLVSVRQIIRCRFLGWLPQPYIDLARVRTGAALPDPYPPTQL